MLNVFNIDTTEVNNIKKVWDDYVTNQPNACIYHLSVWKEIITDTFGHEAFYLMAEDQKKTKGVLPLFFMNNLIFGRFLISIPFIDRAGMLADDTHIVNLFCDKGIKLAQEKQVDFLELRNQTKIDHPDLLTISHKVNFVLETHLDSEFVWKKILQKNVKNKVRIAQKKKLIIDQGNNLQFLDDFYHVYCVNMKYLGTPVYPKKFFLNIHKKFPDQIVIFLAKHQNNVIGGKIVLIFRDTAYFISQASLRKFSDYHPNNLLYWAAIEYSIQKGCKFCDMGRSNIDSGPFKFKKQWGADVHPLFWQYYLFKAEKLPELNPSNPKFATAIKIWQHLPLSLTKMLGPLISKHIP